MSSAIVMNPFPPTFIGVVLPIVRRGVNTTCRCPASIFRISRGFRLPSQGCGSTVMSHFWTYDDSIRKVMMSPIYYPFPSWSVCPICTGSIRSNHSIDSSSCIYSSSSSSSSISRYRNPIYGSVGRGHRSSLFSSSCCGRSIKGCSGSPKLVGWFISSNLGEVGSSPSPPFLRSPP